MGRSVASIGVRWDPRWDPSTVPATAAHIEEWGYDEFWLVEDCFSAGGLTTSTAALASTEKLQIGVGTLPAGVRNAGVSAMEIAAIARLFPGRFTPSFGHGVEAWMRQIGARPERRLRLLEEAVAAVHGLLAGRELNMEGDFVELHDVVLEHPPEPAPPVLVGTTGPRGLDIAGRVGDGAVIPEVASPQAVRWARGIVDRHGAGKRVVVYSFLSIDDDRDAAVAAVRPQIDQWMRSGDFPDMAEQAGLGRDGARRLSDDELRSIAAAGDAADCVRTVAGLCGAGADSVVLLPVGEDPHRQIARFAADCLPQLQ